MKSVTQTNQMMQTRVNVFRLAVSLFLAAVLSQPAFSETLRGRVFRVADGDSISFAVTDGERAGVILAARLWGIDAPEMGQAFGAEAARMLSLFAPTNVVAELEVKTTDDYGRTLGVLSVGGLNVNARMVAAGGAWHYVHYAPDECALASAQKTAKAHRLGLWADANPVPPWDYRISRKKKTQPPALQTAIPPQEQAPAAQKTHWLTSSSGTRHNRSCKLYQNTNGRPCGQKDGRACKICGG